MALEESGSFLKKRTKKLLQMGFALSGRLSYMRCGGLVVPSDQVATPVMKTDSGGRPAASASWPGVKNQ
jgi:hypothetical protein